MNYSLNIAKLVGDYFRPLFNKPKLIAWINACLFPVKTKHDDFLAFKTAIDNEVTITCQVNRLRLALRTKFDDDTIEIIHPGDYLATAYIYLKNEPHPDEYDYLMSEDHTPVEYDYLNGEYLAQVDYIVRIPESLAGSTIEISAFVARYNFTSMTYAIEIA